MTDDSDDYGERPDIEVGPLPRMLCPTCQGMGVISQPKLAVAGGAGRTLATMQDCPQCSGEKFLPDLHPPM